LVQEKAGVALTTKTRNSLYGKFVPILGEEDTAALLDQYPAHELDEPVTKGFVRAEIAESRESLRGEIGELRTEFVEFRGEVHTGFAAVRGEMGEVRASLEWKMTEMQTALRGEMDTQSAMLRGEMATMQAAIERRLTDQTKWVTSVIVTSMAVLTAIVGLIG
jgi:hypothetical protein